jgi:hypothetical protein
MVLAAAIFLVGATVPLLVLLMRWLDERSWRRSLQAFRLIPPTGLDIDAVTAWLGAISALTHAPRFGLLPLPPVVVEVVGRPVGIAHFLLVPAKLHAGVLSSVRAHLPGARVEEAPSHLAERPSFRVAAEWRLTSRRRPLATERAETVATSLLHAFQPLHRAEQIVMQWIFTGAGTPRPVPPATRGRRADVPSWWLESANPADSEEVQAARRKRQEPMVHAVGRLGVLAASRDRSYRLFGQAWAAPRQLSAPGVGLVRRWLPSRMIARRLRRISLPVLDWPVLLNVREAAGVVGLPIGKRALPGLTQSVARQVPPPQAISTRGTVLARSNYPGSTRLLRVSREDRLRHLYAVGPTGVGKSTLLANLAIQDIAYGDGLVLVDPKGDLVNDVLAGVPESRRDDVIVLQAGDTSCPVGLNLLTGHQGEHARELAADQVLHVLKSLWAASWGPRTDAVLRASLLTHTHTRAADGSAFTLVDLVPLLTNAAFRRTVVSQDSVPRAVRGFWQSYEAMGETGRSQIVAPAINKLTSFSDRTSLRLILGQSDGLDITSLMRERKVLLVSLSRGQIGEDAAYLLGALLVSAVWSAALGRAAIAPARRRPFWLVLDEFQQTARLPLSFADMAAEARGYGLGLVLANQHLSQLPETTRAAVLGTVRSQVIFQVEREDARLLESRFAPTLTTTDLTGLAAYEVALRLCAGNQVLPPTTGTTLPLPEPNSDPDKLRAASRQHYGRPRAEIEAAIEARTQGEAMPARVGRTRREGRS